MARISKPINILLVEDNPADVMLTREAFADCNVPVHFDVASDGEMAVKFLRREAPYQHATRPDLILLDLNIPKLDGREVLRFVKSDDELRCIPVVMLTTSTAEQDVVRMYDLHVNAYISKPVDFDKFLEVVHRIESFWLQTAILPTTPVE